MTDLEIDVAGERLLLLPERAVYWGRRQTLFVADTHWGKAATLRAAAIPVPHGTTTDDLARLGSALDRVAAQRLILLGDVLHAREGRAPRTLSAVARWRKQRPALDILMVRGNHDRHAGDPPLDTEIRCATAPLLDAPFAYQHYPSPNPGGYTLAGHLHPAIKLRGLGAARATLPCFYFTGEFAVLPAFGSLTGAAIIHPEPAGRVYAIAGSDVIAIM